MFVSNKDGHTQRKMWEIFLHNISDSLLVHMKTLRPSSCERRRPVRSILSAVLHMPLTWTFTFHLAPPFLSKVLRFQPTNILRLVRNIIHTGRNISRFIFHWPYQLCFLLPPCNKTTFNLVSWYVSYRAFCVISNGMRSDYIYYIRLKSATCFGRYRPKHVGDFNLM